MNKAEITKAIAAKSGLTLKKSGQFMDALEGTITAALAAGDVVKVPNFGKFEATTRKGRTGTNPRTGDGIQIPAAKRVKFTPGKALKDAANAGTIREGQA